MTVVVGVDATRAEGWVAVALEDDRLLSMSTHATLRGVLDEFRAARAVAVDIPIGHEDPAGSQGMGRRACDAAAKVFLPSERRHSVFWVPPPAAMDCTDHTEAVELCRRRGWHAPSAQLWGLRARMLEARDAQSDPRVHEVHPEVSFQALVAKTRPGATLAHAKTTWSGLVERLELLHSVRLRPERSVGGVGRASPDDVLDATIAAWTARRIARGEAEPLPKAPPRDVTSGRTVAIWY